VFVLSPAWINSEGISLVPGDLYHL